MTTEREPGISAQTAPRGNGRSVYWPEEPEALHEGASRAHFLDRWPCSAIVERIGGLASGLALA